MPSTFTDGDTIEVLERQQAENAHHHQNPHPPLTSTSCLKTMRCWWSTNRPNSCPLPRTGWNRIRSTVAASSTYVNPIPRRGASSCTGLTKRRLESWFCQAQAGQRRPSEAISRPRRPSHVSCFGRGKPSTSTGTVRTWLMEDKHLNVKAVNKIAPKRKEAISHYHVLETNDGTAHVEVTIETGRRHQIRMAMQHSTDLLLWGMNVWCNERSTSTDHAARFRSGVLTSGNR